jgi:hypothetical protein
MKFLALYVLFLSSYIYSAAEAPPAKMVRISLPQADLEDYETKSYFNNLSELGPINPNHEKFSIISDGDSPVVSLYERGVPLGVRILNKEISHGRKMTEKESLDIEFSHYQRESSIVRPTSVLFCGYLVDLTRRGQFANRSGIVDSPNVKHGGIYRYNAASYRLAQDRGALGPAPQPGSLRRQKTSSMMASFDRQLGGSGSGKQFKDLSEYLRKVHFKHLKTSESSLYENCSEREHFYHYIFNLWKNIFEEEHPDPSSHSESLVVEHKKKFSSEIDRIRGFIEKEKLGLLHSYQKYKFNYYLDMYQEKQVALQQSREKHLRVVAEAEGGGVSNLAFAALVGGYHEEKLKEQSTATIFEFAENLKMKLSSKREILPEMLSLPLFQEERQKNPKKYFTGESLDEACCSCEGYIPFAKQKEEVQAQVAELDSQHGDVWGVYVDLNSAYGIWHALFIGQNIRQRQPDETPIYYVAHDAKTNKMISLDEEKMRELLTSLFEISKKMEEFEDEGLKIHVSKNFYDLLTT